MTDHNDNPFQTKIAPSRRFVKLGEGDLILPGTVTLTRAEYYAAVEDEPEKK